jgi:hypothetical protein
MNRPIHSSAAEQREIGGVHDGIDVELCDITFDHSGTIHNFAVHHQTINRSI